MHLRKPTRSWNATATRRRRTRGYLTGTQRSPLREKMRGRLLLMERQAASTAARALLAGEPEPAAPGSEANRVAVLPFVYAGTDPELRPLGRAISEMLVTDLSQTDRLVLVERLRLQALLDEMRLGEEGLVDPSTAARTGRLLGAGRTVQGSLGGDAALLQLQATISRAQGTPAGTNPPLTEQDALRRLLDAEKRLVLGLYSSLGVELTSTERERVMQRPTENLQALLAFGSGLEAADAGEFARAAREFARAAALDGGFAGAREHASTARATAAAQATTPATVAQQFGAGVADLTELNELLPGAFGRDVAAEALGGERLGSRDAVLRIILPPRP